MLVVFTLLVTHCLGVGYFVEKYHQSAIFGQLMPYAVYLPVGYDANKTYPIIYMLHALGEDHSTYIAFAPTFNDAMLNEQMTPAIAVTPQAFTSFYVNRYNGTLDYEKYFFEEFMPYIEETYPVDKNNRALMGISMGGFGAAYYSIIHQEMFRSAVALSPGIFAPFTFEYFLSNNSNIVSQVTIDAFGTPEYFYKHCIEIILSQFPAGTFKTPIYGCMGHQDFLYPLVKTTGQVMEKYKMNYIWEDDEIGAHELPYWLTKFPKAFAFIEKHWKRGTA